MLTEGEHLDEKQCDAMLAWRLSILFAHSTA